MPFKAFLDGQPLTAIGISAAGWAEIVQTVRSNPERLTMRCCGTDGLCCTSPRGRYFFRHKRQPPTCDWAPESEEHLDLKEVVALAVCKAGWTAEVEAIGPDWKADVLAVRGAARIALEIQLSAQGQAETARREERYLQAGVIPWWIVNTRNSGDGFGSGLRSVLKESSGHARLSSARKAVAEVLACVERQVEIARAIRQSLVRRGIEYTLLSLGAGESGEGIMRR